MFRIAGQPGSIVMAGIDLSGLSRLFSVVCCEEFVRFDSINAAQRLQFHQAWVRLFAGFEARDIALGDPSAAVFGALRETRHLAHGHLLPIP